MTNTITVPKKLARVVNKITRDLGISSEDFLVSAILYHLKNFKEKIELKKELEIWERVSDQDLSKER